MEAWIWICFRVPMWVFAVGLVSQFVLTEGGVAGRHQKLQELLNSLGTYSKPRENQIIAKDHSETSSASPLSTVAALSPSKEMPPVFAGQNLSSTSIKSYQDFYRVFYGTPEGIEFIRKHYGPTGLQQARANFGITQELEDVRKANEHYLRIRTRARCKVPVARVIRVKDMYPDPSKDYLPRCTVLHRCGDSSGCCENDAFQCVPSAKQEVALHFYVLSVGPHGIYKTGNSIEQLLFVNHTACHCQPINDLPRSQQELDAHLPQVGIQLGSTNHHHQSKCRECPVPFTSRVYVDGRCGCDCFDRQKTCLRIKRGRGPLPDVERRCVEANYCHLPDCEYGIFDVETGYCPKRHDESTRTPSHRSHTSNHRWSFIERD